MKALLYALIIAMSTAFAHAQTACATFEYQELKDLPDDVLVSEYCSALRISDDNISRRIDLFTSGVKPSDMYAVESSKCINSAKRMERLFASRGKQEADYYKAYCK